MIVNIGKERKVSKMETEKKRISKKGLKRVLEASRAFKYWSAEFEKAWEKCGYIQDKMKANEKRKESKMEFKKLKVERKRMVTKELPEIVEIDIRFPTHILYLKADSGHKYRKSYCVMSDEDGLKVGDPVKLNYDDEYKVDGHTIVKVVKLDGHVDEIDVDDIPKD